MDAIGSLRENLSSAHWILGGTMEGVTADQAHRPGIGMSHPIAASYAHLVISEDMILNGMLKGAAPLAASTWAGKTGASEMPPMGSEGPANWSDWAKSVKVDLPAMQAYSQAVFAASDAYLASLKPEDLSQKIETFPGIGQQTRNWMLGILVGHTYSHTGEISAAKGAQGLKGLPF